MELLIRESSGVRMTKEGEELLLHARSALEWASTFSRLPQIRSAASHSTISAWRTASS